MADVKTKRVDIYIDQSSALTALDALQKKSDKLTKAIDAGRAAGKNMTAEIKKLEETKASIANVQSQIDKGLRPSFGQVEAEVRKLRNELKRMSEDAPRYAEKFKEYRKATQQFAEMKSKIDGVSKAHDQMGSGFAKVFSNVSKYASAYLAFDSIKNAAADVISFRAELETSVANLSAITGATGEDLEFLKKAAIDLSKDGTQSAVDFVEAMKLIGSAKPELLAVKEDLVEVTKAAKLLSEASGLELPDAATRLTDALNQFGAPASDAAMYVDALAAAAKYGAAEVPQVTEALLKFGSLAKASNIDIFESAAAIELLAEKGLKGAEAGTALRNVFLKLNAVDVLPKEALAQLEAAGVKTEILKNKNLSLETRLIEFSKIQNNTNALVKVFGAENLNAGQILLQNIPRYAELTGQLKEQGVAAQQASANTNTLTAKWQMFKNVVMSIFAEGNNDWLKAGIDFLTRGATGLGNVVDHITKTAAFNIQQLKTAFSIAKDLATFDFKGAGENFDKYRNNKRETTNLEKKKYLTYAGDPVEAAIKAAEARKASEKAAADKAAAEKKEAEDKAKAEAALKRTEAGTKKASDSHKKAIDEAKRAMEEYNRFARDLNRSINDLLTPEASRKWAAVIRDAEDEIDKINKLAVDHAGKQQLINGVLEKQKLKFRELAEEAAKVVKAPLNNSTVVDLPKGFDKPLKEEKVPIQFLPEIKEEDVKAAGESMLKAIHHATEEARKKFEDLLGDIQQGLEFASQVNDVFSNFAQAKSNKETAAFNREINKNDKLKASYKKQLDAKLISQQEYNRRVNGLDAAADKKREELEAKQAARNRKFAMFQAGINGAQAVTKTLADFGVPFPPNFLGILAMGITLASIASQFALIKSQKFADGGQVQAPELKNGKINIASNIATQPNGDNVLATVKTGEVILNEDQQRKLGGPDTFKKIGVPGFANGGRVKPFWESRPYKSLNYAGIKKSMQVNKYAEGGLVAEQLKKFSIEGSANSGTGKQERLMEEQALLIKEQSELMKDLRDYLANPVNPVITFNQIQDAIKIKNRVDKNSQFK